MRVNTGPRDGRTEPNTARIEFLQHTDKVVRAVVAMLNGATLDDVDVPDNVPAIPAVPVDDSAALAAEPHSTSRKVQLSQWNKELRENSVRTRGPPRKLTGSEIASRLKQLMDHYKGQPERMKKFEEGLHAEVKTTWAKLLKAAETSVNNHTTSQCGKTTTDVNAHTSAELLKLSTGHVPEDADDVAQLNAIRLAKTALQSKENTIKARMESKKGDAADRLLQAAADVGPDASSASLSAQAKLLQQAAREATARERKQAKEQVAPKAAPKAEAAAKAPAKKKAAAPKADKA